MSKTARGHQKILMITLNELEKDLRRQEERLLEERLGLKKSLDVHSDAFVVRRTLLQPSDGGT